MSRYKPVGWRYESARHSLARKGIKTTLKYGGLPDNLFIKSQLKEGIEVEKEHTDNPALAKQIAKAHLVEDPVYYTKLRTIEQKPPGKISVVHGIPLSAAKLEEGRIYPISSEEVKKILERMPKDDLKGIKKVEFTNPKGDQENAWAQYMRGKRVVKIFSQQYEDGKIDGQDPEQVRKHIRDYVIPHEVGHHKALYKARITDKDLEMAEARADANVVGMDVKDKDVKILRSYAQIR